MIKNTFAAFITCLALFVFAVGGSATGAKTRATPRAELTSATNHPVPPRTVHVRLVYVETNMDSIDSPVTDSNIIIQAGAERFEKRTDKDGVVVFDAIPCGGEIRITVRDQADDEETVIRRKLLCQGREVYLGAITTSFGGKPVLERRRTEFFGYDVNRGVWRDKNNRIVPNSRIRGLQRKRQ